MQVLLDDKDEERYLANFDTSLAVAKLDVAASNNSLQTYHNQLRKIIDDGKRHSQYNHLFASIMSQWLSEQQNKFTLFETESIPKECLPTKEIPDAIIFNRAGLDLDGWRDFLQKKVSSFFDQHAKRESALQRLKTRTTEYGQTLLKSTVTSDNVIQAIQSLLSSDSFDEHQKSSLHKLKTDKAALADLASSVNLLIANLAEWNWPAEGVRGVFRRNLLGKYRCFYGQSFLTAIFLQHIGAKWSYHFKRELRILFYALVEDTENSCSPTSIQNERLEIQRAEYWVETLPDDDDSANNDMYGSGANDVRLKEKVLDLINAEMKLRQALYPEMPFTVVCADLEDFGPRISHDIVHRFLQSCGVPQIWLDFFDRFLQQRVYYQPEEPVRQRQRGVPTGYSLSYLFSELLLFGMDLYVYSNTGVFNYRFHDDFWLFDSQSSKIQQAWQLMNEYASITGLRFNKDKCGSIQLLSSATTNPPVVSSVESTLPQSDVKWGLLSLQANGHFTPNHRAILPLIHEMKERLNSVTTVLEWVIVYNTYMTFFMRNVGKYANVLGMDDREEIVKTFQYIRQNLFPENNGNALAVLTDLIKQHFPEWVPNDIIDGWFYWPLKKGGLGMTNVYLDVYSVFSRLPDKTKTTFPMLLEQDQQSNDDYDDEEAGNDTDEETAEESRNDTGERDSETTSVAHEDYAEECQNNSVRWGDVYVELLEIKKPTCPILAEVLQRRLLSFHSRTAQSPVQEQPGENGSLLPLCSWQQRDKELTDAYTQWLLCQHSEQIKSTFGQLDVVDSNKLPVVLVPMIERAKINWIKRTK